MLNICLNKNVLEIINSYEIKLHLIEKDKEKEEKKTANSHTYNKVSFIIRIKDILRLYWTLEYYNNMSYRP